MFNLSTTVLIGGWILKPTKFRIPVSLKMALIAAKVERRNQITSEFITEETKLSRERHLWDQSWVMTNLSDPNKERKSSKKLLLSIQEL